MEKCRYEIITHRVGNTPAGGNFIDKKYDPRGDIPSPNAEFLLISDEELARRIKEFQKKQKID